MRIGDRKTGFEGQLAEDFHAAVGLAFDWPNVKFGDGESFIEEKLRVYSFLDEITKGHYASVLVVTHAEIMKLIYGYFHKLDNQAIWDMQGFRNTEVISFETYALMHDITRANWPGERQEFLSKGQPCLRASALGKCYGWGIHNDADGRNSIAAVESPEYEAFIADPHIVKTKALRSKRA